MVAIPTALPIIAEASFFSFIAGLFNASIEKGPSQSLLNSQTVELLSPENGAVGGGDVSIVDGQALLSEDGGRTATDGVPTSDKISVYIVKKGDSLSAIARMFGVTVNTIVWANDISRGIISEGQRLVILPISGIRYTVKSGDTFKTIASKYKGDADEIASYNGMQGSKLVIGDEILIPDGEISLPAPAATRINAKSTGSSSASADGYYIRPVGNNAVKTQGLHGFNGVDLALSLGSPVVASASGSVIISRSGGWNGGYGQYIVISHDNGTQTLYAHLSANLVAEGTRVSQGELIGRIGSTGRSTGSHVHFEIRGARNPF